MCVSFPLFGSNLFVIGLPGILDVYVKEKAIDVVIEKARVKVFLRAAGIYDWTDSAGFASLRYVSRPGIVLGTEGFWSTLKKIQEKKSSGLAAIFCESHCGLNFFSSFLS